MQNKTNIQEETMPDATLTKQEEYTPKTMFQIIFSQFLEHRFAVIGVTTILVFIFIALFAPVITMITGLHPYTQNMYNRYKKPFTSVVYSTDMVETSLKKFIQKHPHEIKPLTKAIQESGIKQVADGSIDFERSDLDILISMYDMIKENGNIIKDLEGIASPPLMRFLTQVKSFRTFHVFGTDELGRDVLIRLIYGARVSIGVGILVAVCGAIVGLMIGSLAGFYGGWIDIILMRITDSLLSLPILPILIVLCAVDLKKIPILDRLLDTSGESIFKLVFVLALFSWMTVARLVRGCILSLKEQEFIHAAKTLGAKDNFIIRVHLIPNVLAPLLVAVTVGVGNSILMEAALSFLGLGIQPPIPSWGNMLMNAIELVYEAPIIAILPGLLILIVVVSFNFFGDGLQDAVDPQAIRR